MRKLCTLALALLLAVAFLIVASPTASAFGSEVLGCNAGQGWQANACGDGKQHYDGDLIDVVFSPSNTSGTYGTSWTVNDSGVLVTTHCVSINNNACIVSGCFAGAMNCQVQDHVGNAYLITGYLTLTQSGKSETLTAQATINDPQGGCRTC